MTNIPEGANTLFVISTSHMDWNWTSQFEQYYASGTSSSVNNGGPDGAAPVRQILHDAMQFIKNPATDGYPGYMYNLAEVAWLQRYIQDDPSCIKDLAKMHGRFYFLGGGITSPDNLVCNGEAFIRNYLVGRNYLKKMGLGKLLTNVCWIPDDFGSDPQLPVVLNAMNFDGVSFWRIPNSGSAGPASNPIDGGEALDTKLDAKGVTFHWEAADKSTTIAVHMNKGYGVIWDQSYPSNSNFGADSLLSFATAAQTIYPGGIAMAPCGGDFSAPSVKPVTSVSPFPNPELCQAVTYYNNNYYGKNNNTYYAVMGTFADFIRATKEKMKTTTDLFDKRRKFDSSNYYTGHFSSHPELKVNQQRAVNRLMAAETLSTLLRSMSPLSASVLNGLDNMIGSAWENLLPSTHHDFITGTAPDAVYLTEQLPLSTLALSQGKSAVSHAMNLLGTVVNAGAGTGEVPYVVFNACGCTRTIGNLVEIPGDEKLSAMQSFHAGDATELYPLQRLKNGNILISVNAVIGMTYTTVNFSPLAPNQPIPVGIIPGIQDSYTIDNGRVQITISKSGGWSINNLTDLSNNNVIISGAKRGNQISVYYEQAQNNGSSNAATQGNLYRMGNELFSHKGSNPDISTDGFYTDTTSDFTGLEGKILEAGPYRWHFRGEIQNKTNKLRVTVEYFLERGEPLVRVKIKGRATHDPSVPASIVTSWELDAAPASVPALINYGTGNHWNALEARAYWMGPTFSSTHDFVTVQNAATPDGNPLGAIYHEAMRAWAIQNNMLLGILFRNAPGTGNAAAGSDTDQHTQNFSFRIPDSSFQNPATCQPLQESLAFQQPLFAAPIARRNTFLKSTTSQNTQVTSPKSIPALTGYIASLLDLSTMPSTGTLATITEPNAIIRVARTQTGSGTTVAPANNAFLVPFSYVLRIYQPTNTHTGTFNINVPSLVGRTSGSYQAVVNLVSALEEDIPETKTPLIPDSTGTIQITAMHTLTTLRIQTYADTITPVNGKPRNGY